MITTIPDSITGIVAIDTARIHDLRVIATGTNYFPTLTGISPDILLSVDNGATWHASVELPTLVDEEVIIKVRAFSSTAKTVSDNIVVNWLDTHPGWEPLGDGLQSGWVSSVDVDSQGNVWAAGSFTQSGSKPIPYLGKWDGSSWSSPIETLTMAAAGHHWNNVVVVDSSDNVYFHGGFTHINGEPFNNIAMWDGTNWNALGEGLQSTGMPLSPRIYIGPYDGKIYAFRSGANMGIYRWDGSSWESIGGSFGSGHLIDITWRPSDQKMFGISRGSTGRLYEYTGGTNWSHVFSFGISIQPQALSLAFDSNDKLYIGGPRVDPIGDITDANRIFSWEGGENFGKLRNGVSNIVNHIIVRPNDEVYVCGRFARQAVTSEPLGRIGQWHDDIENWSQVGGGLPTSNEAVYMKATENSLYVGGSFNEAQGGAPNRIARWRF